MDATEFQSHLEAEFETELSRLGSSKALYAITAGEMDTETVLAGIADRLQTATTTVQTWLDTDQSPAELSTVVEQLQEQSDRIIDASSQDAPDETPSALDDYLRDQEDSIGKLAGLVAWSMVQERTYSQAVGFFVGNADRSLADLFRDLRDDVSDLTESALDQLADACESEADWDHATSVAGNSIEHAYAHYVDVLEDMGIKVKPVC